MSTAVASATGRACHNANPGPDRLAELSIVLVVSYGEWLATGRGEMKLGHDPANDIPAAFGKLVDEPELLRVVDAWGRMSLRSRNALLEIAEELAQVPQAQDGEAQRYDPA